jgi:hypothetical protein
MCPIWSFIINCVYWIGHFNDFKYAKNQKTIIKKYTKNLDNVKENLLNFKYQTDSFKDWRPWIITLLNKNHHDDCDGAAIYAKWLLSLIKINSNVVHLIGPVYAHAICLYHDHTHFVSNGHIITIENPKKYKNEIYNYFNNKYNWMIK